MDTQKKHSEAANEKDTSGMTPSELIHYHLKYPKAPVTDEEISNTKISDEEPPSPSKTTDDTKDKMNKEKEDKEERDFPIQSSYNMLGS